MGLSTIEPPNYSGLPILFFPLVGGAGSCNLPNESTRLRSYGKELGSSQAFGFRLPAVVICSLKVIRVLGERLPKREGIIPVGTKLSNKGGHIWLSRRSCGLNPGKPRALWG
jgi:hypothetical protein